MTVSRGATKRVKMGAPLLAAVQVQLEKGMLANPRNHQITRLIRLLLFSIVTAILVVSLLIVVISFVWDRFLAEPLNRPPYAPRIEFVAPSIVLVALIFSKILWDAAEGRSGPARSKKPSRRL